MNECAFLLIWFYFSTYCVIRITKCSIRRRSSLRVNIYIMMSFKRNIAYSLYAIFRWKPIMRKHTSFFFLPFLRWGINPHKLVCFYCTSISILSCCGLITVFQDFDYWFSYKINNYASECEIVDPTSQGSGGVRRPPLRSWHI